MRREATWRVRHMTAPDFGPG
ncbi:MAG: hypothetical protein QOI76_4033, partial [Frankiales bacterium]|nr:hypothetical protein [Frankiales bacterium]